MNAEEMKKRTMKFALDVIAFVATLPNTFASRTIGGQLIRSATSVASNYRASRRAKSDDDFLYKMKIVEEEVDESECWLEMLVTSKIAATPTALRLLREAGELTAIVSASVVSTKARMARDKSFAKQAIS